MIVSSQQCSRLYSLIACSVPASKVFRVDGRFLIAKWSQAHVRRYYWSRISPQADVIFSFLHRFAGYNGPVFCQA